MKIQASMIYCFKRWFLKWFENSLILSDGTRLSKRLIGVAHRVGSWFIKFQEQLLPELIFNIVLIPDITLPYAEFVSEKQFARRKLSARVVEKRDTHWIANAFQPIKPKPGSLSVSNLYILRKFNPHVSYSLKMESWNF